MADGNLMMKIAIGATLAGGFAATFSRAQNSIRMLSTNTAKYEQSVRRLSPQLARLNADYARGAISAKTYSASIASIKAPLQKVEAVQGINRVTQGLQKLGGITSSIVSKFSSLAMYAAGGFGLFSFADSAVNAGERVYQLSVRLGISAGEAAKFNRIMQFTGVDTQTAAMAFTRLDRTLIKGGKSADAMQAYLSQYGVSLRDVKGNLLPLNQQIDAMAKGYERAKAEGKGEEFVMQTMGNRGMELIKTFENLKTAKEAAAKVKTTGLNINQMHDAYVNMQALKMQASQLQLSLASAFAPLVQELMPMIMPALQKLAQYIKENKETLASLAVNGAKAMIAIYGVSKGVGGIRSLVSGTKTAITTFKLLSNIVPLVGRGLSTGLFKVFFTTLVTGGGAVMKFGMLCAKAFRLVGIAFRVLSAAMMSNPIILIIMAIALAAFLIYRYWGPIKTFFINLWASISQRASQAWNWIKGVWAGVVGFFSGLWSGIVASCSAAWQFILSIITAVWNWIVSAWNSVKSVLTSVWNSAVDAVNNFVQSVYSAIGNAVQWVMDKWNALKEALSHPIDAVVNMIGGGSSPAHNAMGGIYGQGAFLTTFAEDSPEAAIPIDGSKRAENLWMRTGQMMGLLSYGQNNKKALDPSRLATNRAHGGGTVIANFNPTINIRGNADGHEVRNALKQSIDDFKNMMQSVRHNQRRLSYE